MTARAVSALEALARRRLQRIDQLEQEIAAKRVAITLNHQDGSTASRSMDDVGRWQRYITAIDERAERLYAEITALERQRDAILAAQEIG